MQFLAFGEKYSTGFAANHDSTTLVAAV
jgi:hypothetical protein